ncbi:MAG: HAD-IIB family hydrolase [Synechococcus sp.]|nr:HAD-IIB family hydrolase [Synechococcus sp.]
MAKKLLLCTDLDRTLIPNGEAPESPQARDYFRHLVARPEVTLVYVTGRHLSLIEKAIVEYQLPWPQFAIADVGSSIYTRQNSQWCRWQIWDDHLAQDWPVEGAITLHRYLGSRTNLVLQEPEKQGHYKLSYYVDLQENSAELIPELQKIFQQEKIAVNLIWSIDEAKNIGLLDILPRQANKYKAILFLINTYRIRLNQTLFAGDSGNDQDVLQSPIPAVLVANAHGDLKKRLHHHCQENLYFAQGNYLGMNGNYSAGILEGIVHYFPHYHEGLKDFSKGIKRLGNLRND